MHTNTQREKEWETEKRKSLADCRLPTQSALFAERETSCAQTSEQLSKESEHLTSTGGACCHIVRRWAAVTVCQHADWVGRLADAWMARANACSTAKHCSTCKQIVSPVSNSWSSACSSSSSNRQYQPMFALCLLKPTRAGVDKICLTMESCCLRNSIGFCWMLSTCVCLSPFVCLSAVVKLLLVWPLLFMLPTKGKPETQWLATCKRIQMFKLPSGVGAELVELTVYWRQLNSTHS